MDDQTTNDRLANDRTYLAWLRTGIALFGLGFVVAKFALIVRRGVTHQDLYSTAGIVLIFCGAGLIVTGYLQHDHLARKLRADVEAPAPKARWPLTITGVAVAAALLLSVLIIVST